MPNTNYETDSGDLLADFLIRPVKRITVSKESENMPTTPPDLETKIIQLNNLELNSLHYVCGYIMSSICKTQKICDSCIDSAGSKTYDSKVKYSRLVSLKCYRQKTLFFVNDNTFNFFIEMYIVITRYLSYIKQTNCDIVKFFMNKLENVECNTLKRCHDLCNKIKIRFIKYKLKKSCQPGRLEQPVFNSKTMAMHSLIK